MTSQHIYALFMVLSASIVRGTWETGPWWTNCAKDCATKWSDTYWPDSVNEFCNDSEVMSSAMDCISAASCKEDEKVDATSSIVSLCSEATAGSLPTQISDWSDWIEGDEGPWTIGGPFGDGGGPQWASGGPWTAWWNGNDCPGSAWSGWTEGQWSTEAEWTTWHGCTAITKTTVLKTTVNGAESTLTSYATQVAQVTGGQDESPDEGFVSSNGLSSISGFDHQLELFGAVAVGIFCIMIAL